MKKLYFVCMFLIILFCFPLLNAKFACGYVNSSSSYSPSWEKVIVWAEEKPTIFTSCSANPENKYCCDLDELASVNLNPGKKIIAEIYNSENGLVAGPVSKLITEEGYEIFPQLNLEEAIKLNLTDNSLVINQSSIQINSILAQNYANLKYKINEGEYQQVCTGCNYAEFAIPLQKGKNELIFTAYGNRNISKKIIIYNLDFLKLKLNAFCKKCIVKGDLLYIPSESEIFLESSLESSHPITGDFLMYIPLDWNFTNSSFLQDYSQSHSVLLEKISDEKYFLKNYSIKSPKTTFKKEYLFNQQFGNINLTTNVIVYKNNFLPFKTLKKFSKNYFGGYLNQKGSPTEPIIVNSSKTSYLKTVAIFPETAINQSYSIILSNKKGKENFFELFSTIPDSEIKEIFFVFSVKKNKEIGFYDASGKPIEVELYMEDSEYNYYSTYVNSKGPFSLKID